MQFSLSKNIHGRFQEFALHKGDVDENFFSVFDFEARESGPPDLIWNFAPSTNPYYSPLQPLFLHAIDDADDFKGLPLVLSRDGLLPLMWFFERATVPRFPCKILTHADFSNFIPEDWRPFFGTFRPKSKSRSIRLYRPTKVILHGVAVKNFLKVGFLKKQLQVMLEEIEKQELEIHEFLVMMSFRDDPFYRMESDKFNCLIINEFMANLKLRGKVRFISQREFFHLPSFNECKIFEVNQKFLLADSFINHYALSRGAELLLDPAAPCQEKGQGDEGVRFCELSPFHGMLVRELLQESTLTTSERISHSAIRDLALQEVVNNSERAQIWPFSFVQYVKRLALHL